MNADATQLPPDDHKARLTALLLGELPAAEAESLRAEIAADAELAKVFRRLSLAHELTRETVRSPEPKELSKPEPLQLSAERRAALLAKFKTPPAKVVPLPAPARKAWADRRELLALAAMLVAVVTSAGLLLPSLAKAKSKAQRVSAEHLLAKRAEFETQSEREKLSDAPAKAAASPAAQTMTLGEPSLASRSSLVPAEKRSLAEAKATEEAKGDMVAANATSTAFAVEVKGPAVTSPVLAGGAGDRAGGQDVYNWALNGVTPNASDSKVESADKAHPGNGRASDEFGRDRGYADTSAAPAGLAANQFFGEAPALRGQGIGAGGGLRELDQVTALGVADTENSVRRSIAAVGNTAGGFGGGRGLSAENFGAKESTVAEVDRLAVAETLDSVRLRVPVAGEAQPSRPPLSSLAATDFLERKAGSPLSDVAAVQLFDAPSPAGPLATAGTIVSPGVINGPVLGSNLRGLVDEVVAEGREVRLEQRVNLRKDLAEGAMKRADGADQPGQPSVLASQTTKLAFVVPPPTDSSVAQNEVARQQVALENREGTAAVERFAKATASDATKNRLTLGRGERLADLEVGQAVAVAGKPATTLGYFAEMATNSAQPALGRMFKRGEAKERLAERKVGVAGSTPQQVLSKTQEYPLTESEKAASVVVVDRASAEATPSLFAKFRAALGNSQNATARLQVDPPTLRRSVLGNVEATPAYDPFYLHTEFEVIKSRQILERVAKQLSLSSGEEDFRKLASKISVTPLANTRLVEITVKDADPANAALIANTVAEVYADYRNSVRIELSKRDLEASKSNQSELNQQVATKEAALSDPSWIGVLGQDRDRRPTKLAAGAPEPQPEVATADNAFSTFSLNVSDVSFKLAAAALEKGQMPEPATVRTEEFINAFDYRDPEPAGAAPIAFAWERARYPFAHDRDLVRFSVKTAASGRQPGRPLNLVLLLDNSGSMERADRVRIRQECLRVLAGQLQPQDRVSVVAFARTPRLWVDGLSGAQAAELPGRVGELTPDGGTNLEEALRTAYRTAARHFAANGVNRVVLLTDGAANLGDVQPDSLKKQVEANRKQGIALDCFGIGWEGLNDELLESLSRNGDGRYGFVNTPEAAQSEFAGQLVGALQIAASDVKVQVEWNPRRVTAYRQLGYAKHQLKKEQFRDNTVDAAEIGAAEAGNALYTVQVNPAGEGPLGTVRVRFKVPGTGDYREHEWPLNYDGTARPLDQTGPALRLAASASAFSEWLVSSPWAAEVTPDRLLGLLNGVTDTYAADPRPKQFLQMLQQAKSASGK
jgi:Mg-chelatase subunit ChlD